MVEFQQLGNIDTETTVVDFDLAQPWRTKFLGKHCPIAGRVASFWSGATRLPPLQVADRRIMHGRFSPTYYRGALTGASSTSIHASAAVGCIAAVVVPKKSGLMLGISRTSASASAFGPIARPMDRSTPRRPPSAPVVQLRRHTYSVAAEQDRGACCHSRWRTAQGCARRRAEAQHDHSDQQQR